MHLTGDRRDEVARILRIVAADGLPGPRDLDVALDAIEAALNTADDPVDDDAEFEWMGGKLVALPGWERDEGRTGIRLLSACVDIPLAILKSWSDDECKAAEIWALSVTYSASDNDVCVPPEPDHVKRYHS